MLTRFLGKGLYYDVRAFTFIPAASRWAGPTSRRWTWRLKKSFGSILNEHSCAVGIASMPMNSATGVDIWGKELGFASWLYWEICFLMFSWICGWRLYINEEMIQGTTNYGNNKSFCLLLLQLHLHERLQFIWGQGILLRKQLNKHAVVIFKHFNLM